MFLIKVEKPFFSGNLYIRLIYYMSHNLGHRLGVTIVRQIKVD